MSATNPARALLEQSGRSSPDLKAKTVNGLAGCAFGLTDEAGTRVWKLQLDDDASASLTYTEGSMTGQPPVRHELAGSCLRAPSGKLLLHLSEGADEAAAVIPAQLGFDGPGGTRTLTLKNPPPALQGPEGEADLVLTELRKGR